MAKPKKKPEKTTSGVETLRVGIRLTGNLLQTVRDTRDLLGLHDEATTVRYLMTRGSEAVSEKLRAKRVMDKIESQYAPQQMFEFVQEISKGEPGQLIPVMDERGSETK